MDEARRIRAQSDLIALADGRAGFVVDPFNRRWHKASCPRVRSLTVGQPKWFAPDRPALDQYLQDRHASYPTAKKIEPCPRCGREEAGRSRATTFSTADPPLDVDAAPHRLVVRSGVRVSFGPKVGTPAHQVRSRLQALLGGLAIRDGEKLHAVFTGAIPSNSDVENQLLYNIFDARANSLLVSGVRIEWRPMTTPHAAEYRYESSALADEFAFWKRGTTAAEWPRLPIFAGALDRLLPRVWWTLRNARMNTLEPLSPDDRFCAEIRVGIPSDDLPKLANTDRIKKLIDGAVSAFQLHAAPEEAHARIGAALGVGRQIVAEHLGDSERAVLGRAQEPVGLTAASVKWNPDDVRLAAADISFEPSDRAKWTISGLFAQADRREGSAP